MDQQEEISVEAVLEALLYVVDEPITRDKLFELLPQFDGQEVEEAVTALKERYNAAGGGLLIRDIAGGLLLTTRQECDEYIREYLKVRKRSGLSKQALETLAIIAYEQPITTPEIREIRGSDPSGVIRTLLQKKLIRIAGRKDVVGRPFMYGTTQDFLVHFALNSLDDLPKPEEFAALLDDEIDDEDEPQIVIRGSAPPALGEGADTDDQQDDGGWQRYDQDEY